MNSKTLRERLIYQLEQFRLYVHQHEGFPAIYWHMCAETVCYIMRQEWHSDLWITSKSNSPIDIKLIDVEVLIDQAIPRGRIVLRCDWPIDILEFPVAEARTPRVKTPGYANEVH